VIVGVVEGVYNVLEVILKHRGVTQDDLGAGDRHLELMGVAVQGHADIEDEVSVPAILAEGGFGVLVQVVDDLLGEGAGLIQHRPFLRRGRQRGHGRSGTVAAV
jgi:hypothetical protein